MKMQRVLGFLALFLRFSGFATAFGPSNCVSLEKSSTGTCMFRTNCKGLDISKFEFAFDCSSDLASQQVARHSFGIGGLDDAEVLDTGIKCQRCDAPISSLQTPKAVQPKVKKVNSLVTSSSLHVVSSAASTKSSPISLDSTEYTGKVARYGPNACVATYKNSKGHCVVQTLCNDVPKFASYDVGLICVDAKGVPVRHLFGQGSFKPEETFDSLIECDQCIGLEDMDRRMRLTGSLDVLENQVKSMVNMMKGLGASVQKLNQKVFPQAPAAANASANKTEASVAKAEPVSHQLSQHRSKHQRSHRHHRPKRPHQHHVEHHKAQQHRPHRHRRTRASSDHNDDEEYVRPRLRHRRSARRPAAHVQRMDSDLAADEEEQQGIDETMENAEDLDDDEEEELEAEYFADAADNSLESDE